jgi:hypothetical protein
MDYETKVMPSHTVAKFLRWFEKNIGTETETNEVDAFNASVTCFELTRKELRKVEDYEATL